MNCARYQFLASAGLAGDQNAGVGWRDFGNVREHLFQGHRTSHNLLEHGCFVELFAQRNILVLEPLLRRLAILDIGSGDIPAAEASVFIPKRVPASEKPAIFPVLSE